MVYPSAVAIADIAETIAGQPGREQGFGFGGVAEGGRICSLILFVGTGAPRRYIACEIYLGDLVNVLFRAGRERRSNDQRSMESTDLRWLSYDAGCDCSDHFPLRVLEVTGRNDPCLGYEVGSACDDVGSTC